MIDEDKVCCICGEHKKFLGRVNTGKKFYCNSCMRKINESGMDYWKPCSMVEGFENLLSTRKNRITFKEQLRQIKEEAKNNKKRV